MPSAVEFDNVSIVFGADPKSALPVMDDGADRGRVQQKTGQILGVHNCTLNVAQGEIVVLMGLSGSGKSTLLRAANGLNSVVRGTVRLRYNDALVDLTRADRESLRLMRLNAVAMVFQQFALLPWRTVRENVGMGLEIGGMKEAERQKRVNFHLALVNLLPWADKPVDQLSGGMRQRVGLARAFATEAPILLMDEPFSALDPLIRTRLQDELLGLQKKLQRTIVFVSHDLDEAFKLGNRIAIMDGGRIVQTGTPQQIYTNPVNEYVESFVSHMNPLGVLCARDLVEPLEGDPPFTVPADASVRDVVIRFGRGQHAVVGVVEGGRLIGQVTVDRILAKLVNPRS